MVTFLDQNQRRYGVRMVYSLKQAINGERSLSGKITEPQNVIRRIDRGWRLLIGDEYYVVTYVKPYDKGRLLEVEFDAVHQFFWDFAKSSVHTSLNDGSHTFEEYLHFIFDGSGYSFRNEVKRNAFEKQSFGLKNRLTLFNDIVKQTGIEFVVHGRVVRILNQSGSDLTTVVRKNFNMNELKIEKNIKDFSTYQEGFGAWNDKEDHSKGRLRVTYRSPLAAEYGLIEADPFVDERYTDRESLLERLRSNVDSSYSLSVQIDMEDLTKSGYPYTQPRCGDYIMAINDELGFRRKVRIVSYVSSYDIRGELVGHKITCGNVGAVERSASQVSALSAKIGQAQIETAEAYKAALEALVATNGKNKNYWADTFPTDDPPGTLIKGDQLYYQNGEKTELYIWNGLEWQRAKLGIDEEEFEKELAEVEKQLAEQERLHNEKVAEILVKSANSQDLADEAKRLAEKANADLAEERERSNSAIQNALSEARRLDQEERKATERAILAAKNGAVTEATNLLNVAKRALENDLSSANRLILETRRTLESQVSGMSTELTKTNDTIKTLAKKTDVDRVNQRLSSAETSITQQAGQIALKANQQTVDSLNNRVQSAESSITQQGNQIALKANTLDVNALKNRVSTAESSLTVQAGQMAAKANKSDVDNIGRRITTAEASLSAQAGEIAQRVRKSDFDRETGRLNNVEASVRNLGDRVTTEISQVNTRVQNLRVGARNYAEDYEFKRGLWEYSQGDNSRTVQGVSDGVFTMTTETGVWHQWQIHSESGIRLGGKADSAALLELKTGETYTLSVEVKANSGNPEFWFELRDNGKVNYNNVVTHLYKRVQATQDWVRYSVTGVLKPNSDFSHRRIILGYTAIGSVSFRRVELTQSSMVTDAGPAPEDTVQEIQSVKTTITQTAEGVTQLSTKVNQNRDKLTQQETRVSQLVGDVSSKVSKTDYDNLKRTVDNQTTQLRQTTESIALKADKTTVAAVQALANQAKMESASAKTEASAATRNANEAKATATSAETKANEAKGTAGTALTNANQAKTNAEAADRSSRDAVTKAVAAVAKANGADEKAAEAIRKAGANQESIRQTKADLTVVSNEVRTKVSQVDFNGATQRLATAETTISTLAGQINTKLSRTEVNSIINGKGYQTASQVESAITAKQYVNQTTLTNTISQTERGLLSRITQVETKIPEGYSGANLILEGARQGPGNVWRGATLHKHGFYHNGEKYIFQLNTDKPDEILAGSNRFKVKRNTKYSLSFWTFSSGNMKSFDVFFLARKKDETKDFTSANKIINSKAPSPHRAEYVTVTFDSGDNDEGYIRFDNNGSKDGKVAIFAFGEVMLVEGSTPARYSPAPEELATTVALHEVRDTVDSHTRTLTAQGRSISQFTQTADGLVSRVSSAESGLSRLDGRANFVESALNATKTEVSQLAGSWAVRNLTNSGTVLNQLNLNRDGSVKIDGKLVQITGQTYIQDGVISSAKIGNLDAGKITTGTLNAGDVNIINMNASNIVTGQMSANRIRGGTISSLNDRSQINLQNGRFYVSDNEAGFFRIDSQASTMGLKFINTPVNVGGVSRKVSRVILGGDRRNESSDSNFGWDKGGFTGIVISTIQGTRANENWQSDDLQIISDRVVFSHSYYRDDQTNIPQQGWEMHTFIGNSPRQGHVVLRPYNIDKNLGIIDTGNVYLWPRKGKGVSLIQVLRELKIAFVHIKNAGWSEDARRAIISSIDKLTSMGI